MVKLLMSLLMISMLATSCLKKEEEDDPVETASTTIPDIAINCAANATQCANDGSNNKTITVVLSKVTCSNFQGDASDMYAMGAGIATCSGGVCTGDILAFYNLTTQKETSTISGTVSSLTIVAFIDSDGGEEDSPETGEPVFCKDSVDFTQAITLDNSDWGDES